MSDTIKSRLRSERNSSGRPLLWRIWVLRFGLALLSPLLVLGLLEVFLWALNVGEDTAVFVPDEKPGYFRTNPAFTRLFFPKEFDLKPLAFRLRQHKAVNTIRVFVLGESAVFGTPEPAFSMVEHLRAQLRARYPDKQIEVFNLGITAINSHVILRMVRDVLSFEPDLLIIYAGNNEIVGPFGPGSISSGGMPPLPIIRASVWLRSLRIGQMLMQMLEKFVESRGVVEWQGMRTFSQNSVRDGDPRMTAVYEYFEKNLRDAVQVASSARVHTILSTVIANLKDTAPFLSMHREGLSERELVKWKSAFDGGVRAWQRGDDLLAADLLGQALKLDSAYADTHFLLGRIAMDADRLRDARRFFTDALRLDALRFRPDPKINAAIRRVAYESGSHVTLLDAARELGADPDSLTSLTGRELLFEHVHFNFSGNHQMGRLLAEECARVFSTTAGTGTWLDEDGCAAALGYTEYGYLASLFGIRELTRLSPFTNQITFGEDQARLSYAIDAISSRLLSPDALKIAATRIEHAIDRDVGNPFLLIHLEEIEFQRGSYVQALELVDAAARLRPKTADLIVKRANALRLLKRHREAEEILLESLDLEPNFLPTMGALAEIWSETVQLEKGREFFEHALKRMADSRYVRRTYANLLLRCGDRTAAERLYRDVVQRDPGDEGALARLTHLLIQTGRHGEALELMLAGHRFQPKNYANNARLAQIFEMRNEPDRAVEFMQAMMESGPANSALCLRLAQRLDQLNRPDEMMIALRRAKEAAQREGNHSMLLAAEEMSRGASGGRTRGVAD